MGIWDWFTEQQLEYHERGDRERMRMAGLHEEGFDCHETDPQRTLALFTEGHNLAERLGEPWWVLLYDVWRVIAYTSFLNDYRNVLDLAMHCVLQVRKPQFEGHPWRIAIYNSLLNCYLGIDPVGHAESIRDLLDYLETEIPLEPCPDRYVYLGRRRVFLREVGDWQESYRVTQTLLDLAESDPDRTEAAWYTVADVTDLCWICYNLGDWEGVQATAQQAEELARRVPHSQGHLAEAQFWQAVLARRAGDQAQAQRLFRQAAARLSRLGDQAKKEAFEARIIYHSLGGNLARALQTCEQERELVEPTGRWAYLARVHWHRCRLLAQMGKLRPADLEAARETVRRLKKPEAPLSELAKMEEGRGSQQV